MGLARDPAFPLRSDRLLRLPSFRAPCSLPGKSVPRFDVALEWLARTPSSLVVRLRTASRLCLGLRGPGAGCAGVVTELTKWLPSDSEVNTQPPIPRRRPMNIGSNEIEEIPTIRT